ncbi:MAG: ATP-binding cassette domain-containing protein [Peptococcaceae bacterium]|nr:ATP-binding cassette domain-containing protein [Peptococcaceae bacterium]
MLKISRACKTFQAGTVNEHAALREVSLNLAPGEFVTVIGPNGAGKSTLFNAISGQFWLDSGNIRLAGRDITYEKEHKRAALMGRLFQDPLRGTAPQMTVEENLALAYNRRKLGLLQLAVSRKNSAFFREKLAAFGMGLEDRLQSKMGLLSGGQRQAVALLMCTVASPRLLLLDEHTAALDPLAAEKVMKITEEIVSRQKLTTLMITHNMKDALVTGSRTIMLEQGRILLDLSGPEREAMTLPKLLELYRQSGQGELDEDRLLLVK